SSKSPTVYGEPVTFTATVIAIAPGAGTPSGTVDFLVDGSPAQQGVGLNGGKATFSTTTLTAVSHTITVHYSGDTSFKTSDSSGLTQVVNKASSSVTVSSSLNPSTFGQAVTFTGTVVAVAPGGNTPAGSVDFLVDGSQQATNVGLDGNG